MIKELAQQVADLDRQVRALSKMRIEGYGRSGGGASGAISFARTVQRSDDPRYVVPRTVVIVRKPTVDHDFLLVREAVYASDIPKKCEGTDPNKVCYYEWKGPDFEVYPPLGMECIDYDGDEFTGDTPKHDTVFHRCTYQHDYWMLENAPKSTGGGGIVPARVLATPATGATTISVQPVKRSTAVPQPTDPWVNDGVSVTVPLWSRQKGEDFQTLVGDVIPLVVIAGERYAMQYLWFYTKTPNPAIPKGDCGL